MQLRVRIAAAVAAVLVAAFAMWPREPATPEEQIRRLAIQVIRAAERKDLAFVMDQLSPSFQTANGETRDEVKSLLAAELLRRSWMHIAIERIDPSLTAPDRAELSAEILFARSDASRIRDLPSATTQDRVRFDATLESDGKRWRFVSARWRSEDPPSW